jgi:hypothetical protein
MDRAPGPATGSDAGKQKEQPMNRREPGGEVPSRTFTASDDRTAGWITERAFQRCAWRSRPALRSRNGTSLRPYDGGAFDAEEWEVVPGAWDHDHCLICCDTICEHAEHGCAEAYVNARGQWLCPPCFEHYFPDGPEPSAVAPQPGAPARLYPAPPLGQADEPE